MVIEKVEEKTKTGFNVKIVVKHLKPYKKDFLVLGFLGIISAFANGLVPLVVGRFFDALLALGQTFNIIGKIEIPFWAVLLLVWTVLQIVANVIDYVMVNRRNYLGEKVYSNFVTNSLHHLISLPASFFKDHRVGDTHERVSRASNDLDQLLSQVLIDIAPQLLTLIIGVFIVGGINPTLAGMLILGMLLYIATLFKVVPPVAVLQRESRKAYGDASSLAVETLSHYDLIKQSTSEEYSKKQVSWQYLSNVLPKAFKTMQVWVNINRSQRVIVVITQLAVFVFSVSLIQKNLLSIGELIAVNSYAGMIFGPFAMVGRNWLSIQNVSVSLERVEEYLSLETEEMADKNKKEVLSLKEEVSFNNVSFSYKNEGHLVLNNVSFAVSPGQRVALVGESGVGKSTTIQLISGYYLPKEGDIFIGKNSLKDIKRSSLRKHIGVVPQEVVLFNDSILNNIRYGSFDRTEEEVRKAAEQAHADIFIEKFPEKYNQLVGERGIKLSVGEKQRVAIARAILRDPKILILDEPTSALDPQTERQITESLEKLMQGRTTFIIAHRLSTVRRADKIFVFDKGKIVEQGNHEELLAQNGLYKKLHDLHVGLH